MDQRARLLTGTERLADSSRKLQDSHRIALETGKDHISLLKIIFFLFYLNFLYLILTFQKPLAPMFWRIFVDKENKSCILEILYVSYIIIFVKGLKRFKKKIIS